jgi:serine/threonine-protein kinase RsbW
LAGSEAFVVLGTRKNGLPFLRVAFTGNRKGLSSLEIEAGMPSEVKAISPFVDRLMQLIEGSRCVAGNEPEVELALHEALGNAVVHGNRMDPQKLVHIQCYCESGKGISLVITDVGQGFDQSAIPDPLSIDSLRAEHGRGIHLMRLAMDEVSFERGGTEVHMRKGRRKQ